MSIDAVRDYLRLRGAPSHVIEGGLEYLVEWWEGVAGEVEAGYEGLVEEWLNDLDGRRLLAEVLEHVPEAWPALPRVQAADERFRSATDQTEECAWGDEIAERQGWQRDRYWWYWTRPRSA